ncbi:hypothetical protein LIER_19150 [Lithospermum erythrorhizon]|uniref:Uncharacterized protein n=1 Tax=Lithospermum erythrorhizon TaxID=34254 RepID=A0AAV3QHW2_LITER
MTLKGFLTPVQGPKLERGTMNPRAYDLLVKEGYDPTKDAAMGKFIPEVKTHGHTPKPPLRILVKRVVDQPRAATIRTPLEKKRSYQQKVTPQKWGAVPWVYPTKLERGEKKTKQLKASRHKRSTRSHKQTPIQQWRVVQTPQAAKKEADSSSHITIDEGEFS